MDTSMDQTISPSPDGFFGSVDLVAFAFAIAASILASFSLMDQSAEATRKRAVLPVVKGMRLMFIPEAVGSLHLHGDIWTKPQLQHFLIEQPGRISLMIRHPCGWKSCPAMDKANVAYNDFVNLSCIKILDDFEGTMKMMFLIRWHISALRSCYTWYTRKPKPISEAEFNKKLDEWFFNSLASCTDMTEEEMEFLEKLACMRMLRWNRFVGDDTTKFAWEVPRQRKYTNLWFILGMKAILRTDYPEGNYTISSSGAWASVERVGMTWHMRSGSRRQGFWTTRRIWDLEEKRWQQPSGRVELDMNPELTCMNQLATPILDFGNCVNAGPNALFFIQTEKSMIADFILNLFKCEQGKKSSEWDIALDILGSISLVFSCLFMVELIASIWAFGWKYFKSWFHCFDAFIVLAGFFTDVLLRGIVEEVASLIVVMRLWRVVKIIEELGLGAQEQTEELSEKIEQCEMANEALRKEVEGLRIRLRKADVNDSIDETETAG
ncbi:hypothetical protein HG530_001643 [Fusarium avenaceum]|nr:hypothetical protein HG530_001643 [Fusarium avenaceum]